MWYKEYIVLYKWYKYNIGKSGAYFIYTHIMSVRAKALVLHRNYLLYKYVIANWDVIISFMVIYIYKYIVHITLYMRYSNILLRTSKPKLSLSLD